MLMTYNWTIWFSETDGEEDFTTWSLLQRTLVDLLQEVITLGNSSILRCVADSGGDYVRLMYGNLTANYTSNLLVFSGLIGVTESGLFSEQDIMGSKADRVFLWACPRSLSSALMRAIINRPRTKGFWEPFYEAYCLGSERVSKRFDGITPIQDNCTFLDIKKLCEVDYPGYDMIFVKDQSHRFPDRMNMIPEGFKHTFILRNPRDSVSSIYKALTTFGVPGFQSFDPVEVGYRELYQIFKYVTEELGQEAVVVETKDLLDHPEAMIHLYCDKVGIPFCKEMLNWSTKQEDLEVFPLDHAPWVKDLLSGTTFRPYKPKPPETFPEDVEAAIADHMPFYEKLYEHRLKVDASNLE